MVWNISFFFPFLQNELIIYIYFFIFKINCNNLNKNKKKCHLTMRGKCQGGFYNLTKKGNILEFILELFFNKTFPIYCAQKKTVGKGAGAGRSRRIPTGEKKKSFL